MAATACDLNPVEAAACPADGLRCDPRCCGWASTCVAGGWVLEDVPCSP